MRNNIKRNQEGVVGMMFAMILPVLMIFLALAIDTSRYYATQAKLASAQDAGALAVAVTPDSYQYSSFVGCSNCSSGGAPASGSPLLGTAAYGKKYLALNLGDSYLGTDVRGVVFRDGTAAENELGAVVADSRDVKITPLFVQRSGGMSNGTKANINKAGNSTVVTPVLLGFVLDVSDSMKNDIGGNSNKLRIEALQEALEGYINAITITQPNGTKEIAPGYEIAFADFARDSGYRLIQTMFWGDNEQGDLVNYYDTSLTHIPDYMNFSSSYSAIDNFVGGTGHSNSSVTCQVGKAAPPFSICGSGKGKNESGFRVNGGSDHNASDYSSGSCASCGLYKISDFFTAKEDANDANFKPYGLPCSTNHVCNSHTQTKWGYTSEHVASSRYPYYQRIIVLMSDGAFINSDNANKNDDDAFVGHTQKGIYGTTIYRYVGPSPNLNGTVEVTYNTCDTLRAAGYKIIAVQFGSTGNATYSGQMKRCATGSTSATSVDIYNPLTNTTTNDRVYFTAETANELKTVFVNIAASTRSSSEIRTMK